ncbi:MAG: TetR/AcrR family transcriptional regulator, partial [Gemmatimonadaceae bacterium]|nr:TetR/AcrR family transcriptional regulator [Gemmatimonadaceae bacterium]
MRKTPTRRPARRSYHHHDLPQALVEAALTLVADEGLAAVSLRRLAQQVGVSAAAPYRHFPTRAALLAAIATDGYVRLRDALTRASEAMRAHPDRILSAQGVAYVQFAVTAPGYFRIMQTPELGDRTEFPALQAAHDAAFLVLRSAVEAEQQAGRFPPGNADLLALGPWS